MTLQSMRGAFAINRGYVCLHCRLQNAPINFQRALRNQHTSPDPQDDSFLNTAFKNLAANLTTDIKARAKRKPKKASTEYLKPAGAELQDGIQQKNDREEEGRLQKNSSASSLPSSISDQVQKEVPITSTNQDQKTMKLFEAKGSEGSEKAQLIEPRSKTSSPRRPKKALRRKNIRPGTRASLSLPIVRKHFNSITTNLNIRNHKINRDSPGTKVWSLPISIPTLDSPAAHKDAPGMCQSLDVGQVNPKVPLVRRLFTKEHLEPGQVFEKVLSPPTLRRNIDRASLLARRRKIDRASSPAQKQKIDRASTREADVNPQIKKIFANQLELNSIRVDQRPIPTLSYGLERVLFNPGVYQLQDLRSRVFNFDPYLQNIMPAAEFDFNSLKEYITSSGDKSLVELAQNHGRRYVGSSSSMTGVLSHFHFLLSQWREVNIDMLSKGFPDKGLRKFTTFQRSPAAIFLKWKNGIYAMDADKEFASANILSMLGKSMEKLLTLDTPDFERYRKSNPEQISSEERNAPETFHYSTMGDFLMRAQLDAYDPRLPGSGTFDLKTRAVLSIRMDADNYSDGVGYEIKQNQGEWESYEREYFDMIRAAFLKYSLQVRMGKMDGIFVAFHNVERIFGFQYITLSDMDLAVHSHSDTMFGDQEFKLSLDLLNKVLDRATKKYPDTTLRIHFETRETQTNFMYIFAEPVTEEHAKEIQSKNDVKIEEFERSILGLHGDKLQENETDWADIEAGVQKAMNEDEMSLADSENGESPNLLDDAIGSLDTTDVSITNAPDNEDEMTLTNSGNKILPTLADDADFNLYSREVSTAPSHEDDLADSTINESTAFATPSINNQRNSGAEMEDSKKGEEEAIEKCLESEEADEETVEDEIGRLDQDSNEGTRKSREETMQADVEEMGHVAEQEKVTGIEGLVKDNLHDQGHRRPVGAFKNPSSSAAMLDQADGQQPKNSDPNESQNSDVDIYEEEDVAEKPYFKGDVPFLKSIETERPLGTSDVLALTLTIRNKVNGKYVPQPRNLKQYEKWEVEYSLTEVSDQSRASVLYQACQLRRKKLLDAEQKNTENDRFFQMLKRMSQQGKLWRKQIDKQDIGKPRVVLKESTIITEETEKADSDLKV